MSNPGGGTGKAVEVPKGEERTSTGGLGDTGERPKAEKMPLPAHPSFRSIWHHTNKRSTATRKAPFRVIPASTTPSRPNQLLEERFLIQTYKVLAHDDLKQDGN